MWECGRKCEEKFSKISRFALSKRGAKWGYDIGAKVLGVRGEQTGEHRLHRRGMEDTERREVAADEPAFVRTTAGKHRWTQMGEMGIEDLRFQVAD